MRFASIDFRSSCLDYIPTPFSCCCVFYCDHGMETIDPRSLTRTVSREIPPSKIPLYVTSLDFSFQRDNCSPNAWEIPPGLHKMTPRAKADLTQFGIDNPVAEVFYILFKKFLSPSLVVPEKVNHPLYLSETPPPPPPLITDSWIFLSCFLATFRRGLVSYFTFSWLAEEVKSLFSSAWISSFF